jgi:hypothetical protein
VESKGPSDATLKQFARLATRDSSPLVRLYLASAMQRVPPAKRWDVLAGLLAHPEDAADHNQPLMVWYAVEPAVELDMPRALTLAAGTRLPNVFAYTVRRIAAVGTQNALRTLTDRLGRAGDTTERTELASGINQIVSRK